MDLIGHLSELRKRLVIVAIVFVSAFIIGFIFAPNLLEYFKSNAAMTIDWNVFKFSDGLLIYLKCALIVAIVASLPVLLYEIWAFVKPGLHPDEAKGAFLYVPFSMLLFIVGIYFSYFIVFPMVIQFMSSINQNIGAIETYGIAEYFTMLFNVVLPIALVFEMPVIVMFLTTIGVINPKRLKKARKVSYFTLVIIGVSLTPPDIVSDILIIIPLFLLFEISIFLSAFVKRRKANHEIDEVMI